MKILASVLFLFFPFLTFGMPQYFNALRGAVPAGKFSAKCATCHQQSGSLALNTFGQDYRGIFVAPNNIKFPGVITMDYKQKFDFLLNKLDSNKNGKSNYQDLIEDIVPGN